MIANGSDTSREARDYQDEQWRSMSVAEKAEIVTQLNRDVRRMAEAGVRSRFPHADEREIFLRLAALMNGRELTVAAYGWDPDVEGW